MNTHSQFPVLMGKSGLELFDIFPPGQLEIHMGKDTVKSIHHSAHQD